MAENWQRWKEQCHNTCHTSQVHQVIVRSSLTGVTDYWKAYKRVKANTGIHEEEHFLQKLMFSPDFQESGDTALQKAAWLKADLLENVATHFPGQPRVCFTPAEVTGKADAQVGYPAHHELELFPWHLWGTHGSPSWTPRIRRHTVKCKSGDL